MENTMDSKVYHLIFMAMSAVVIQQEKMYNL